MRDEIVVPNPFAEAILVYRGGANGEEPPVRIIQGPKTMIGYTDNVATDSTHGEIFSAQFRSDAVLVFDTAANGNVPPKRILRGPKTKLDRPFRVDVDPINNLLAVTTMQGLWIFNRTDNGDVAPRAIIAGPKTGIGGENSLIMKPLFYPKGRKIFIAGGTTYGRGDDGLVGGRISIWKYEDNGDIAPWAVLPASPVTQFRGTNGSMAIDPENKELIIVTAGAIHVYYLPEVFQE